MTKILHFIQNDSDLGLECSLEKMGWRLRRQPIFSKLRTTLKVCHSAAKQGIFFKIIGLRWFRIINQYINLLNGIPTDNPAIVLLTDSFAGSALLVKSVNET